MDTLRNLIKIIHAQSIVITALATLSTCLSRRFGFFTELPIDLLGLAVTQQLFHAHDGSLAEDSEPGKGTRFVVRLPLGSRSA